MRNARVLLGVVVGLMVGFSTAAWGQAAEAAVPEVSRAQIEEAIDRGVQYLVSVQEADGHWAYTPGGKAEELQYKVGTTALAVLALQHSGTKRADAQLAMKKGLSYIVQQTPEPRTYSTGLIMQVLYGDNPTGYQALAAQYAWMVCMGQKREGPQAGSWTYTLPILPANWATRSMTSISEQTGPSDDSNSQFGILALVFAEKMGFQVPRIIWERAREHYKSTQNKDGGWEYRSELYGAGLHGQVPQRSSPSMTLAGTVSAYLCEEMLADKSHKQCAVPAANPVHEAGLAWVGKRWWPHRSYYEWYACERLGVLIGYSEFGGHDWYREGVPDMIAAIGTSADYSDPKVDTSFAVIFLARGRNPIIINKLKREGDWNLHRYDIKNLIEYISGPGQMPCQWRIVTLEAKVEFLLKVPILWISGHEALNFTAEEKAKLKEYVEKGGTILAEDCCSKKPFDESFRALLKELWPDSDLVDLPKTHAIYTNYTKVASAPRLMGLALEKGQGRFGVIYIPNGISCRWEVGGTGARPTMDFGKNIYLYVDKMVKQMRAERSAGEAVKESAGKAGETTP